MTKADLPALLRLADRVHPDLPEPIGVFAERLRLSPTTCLALEAAGALQGYAIAHPWVSGPAPELATLLGMLPVQSDALHLHDVAIAPEFQGRGLVADAIAYMARAARELCLSRLTAVAVHGTAAYWQRHGFVPATWDVPASYGMGVALQQSVWPAGNAMPAPLRVELVPHDPTWRIAAQSEGAALMTALKGVVQTVHHIGSTAIPGISAKPILDLIPVVTSLAELDTYRHVLETLGYAWWGEFGLPGRRYCTKDDTESGDRRVQLHCYADGEAEITRHLAFRDYLRAHPNIAHAYENEKLRCRDLHADDSHAYSDCKSAWICKIEAEALVWYRS